MKRRLLKRFAVGTLLLGVTAACLLNVLAYNQAYAMLHFARDGERTGKIENLSISEKARVLFFGVTLPRPRTHIPIAAIGKDFEEIIIPCADSVRLGALFSEGKPGAPFVLLFHGYSAEKTSLLDEANFFKSLGCSVLLTDFRGSGDSSESYTTIGFHEGADVAAAVAWAQSKKPDAKLVLYGISMGAAAVLRAVYAEVVRPDAIILESVFDSLLKTSENRFQSMGLPSFPFAELLIAWGSVQFGFNGFAHNPATYATRVACPILFLHGTADQRARLSDARRVFDAVGATKRFVEFPGGHHEAYLHTFPDAWKQAMNDFFETANLIPFPQNPLAP